MLQAPETDEFSFVEVPVWKGKSVLSSYDVAYVWIVVVVYHVVCVLLGMVVVMYLVGRFPGILFRDGGDIVRNGLVWLCHTNTILDCSIT